ncbi:MAG: methionyl-tRNA formyltransferase [Oscillospiraceae bacterium]|nr:methionyl-tRNA formyltransferase [Oscillospiraceae bacterium]
MRIVFMGTPDIAATCLKKLLQENMEIVGVYTQPDRPKGRGMKMQYSPVKEVALEHNIPVFQPENFREAETVQQLRDLQPDAVAVVAYGRILPQTVLDIAPNRFINIHASILPQYRGSAPYQWAVLDGLAETGVSAQFMVRQMDAGPVVGVAKTPIGPNETAGELLDRLAVLGADLLYETLMKLENNTLTPTIQDESQVTFAPMLDKSMCPIDFTKTAEAVHNKVRGLNPWPVATAQIGGKQFKVHTTVMVENPTNAPAGTILGLTKTGLQIACGEGAVEIRVLQAEGGKRMAAPDYFRGHPLEA